MIHSLEYQCLYCGEIFKPIEYVRCPKCKESKLLKTLKPLYKINQYIDQINMTNPSPSDPSFNNLSDNTIDNLPDDLIYSEFGF